MIEFHDDHLVPSELCRLLYQAVPKQYHVPVRFHNRRRKDVHGERGAYPLGSVDLKRCKIPVHIDINLNPIYKHSWGHSRFYASAPSTAVWRMLVEVCFHEFGHVATKRVSLRMNHHEYHAEYGYGRVYKAIERLADRWMEGRVARIIEGDPRLRQPPRITGYLGARLIRWRAYASEHNSGAAFSAYVKEMRCRKTGAQLTSGDVLSELRLDPYFYPNAYEVLRRASDGVGIDYADAAGRRHKLYAWGDLPVLIQRINEGACKPRERRYETPERTEREFEFELDDFSDSPF